MKVQSFLPTCASTDHRPALSLHVSQQDGSLKFGNYRSVPLPSLPILSGILILLFADADLVHLSSPAAGFNSTACRKRRPTSETTPPPS